MKLSVIGGGSWGSAFARYLGGIGTHQVMLWVLEPDLLETLQSTRENKLFLPGHLFPDSVSFTNDIGQAVDFGEMVFVAVPSNFCRGVYRRMSGHLKKGQAVVSLTKGFDHTTLKTMSGLMEEIFPAGRALPPAVLSGPSFAREVASGFPTAVVVASHDIRTARMIQETVSSLSMRAYSCSDVIGVETSGALKNVIAIASGIIDSLRYGLNTRAALMTRGLVEISRLGLALGAKKETFSGLAGMGDLVLTCTGELSRNHWVGQQLGQGKKLNEILSGMKMVAEGVPTTLSARKLARSLDVEMPISEQIYQILYKGKDLNKAVSELMTRALKEE